MTHRSDQVDEPTQPDRKHGAEQVERHEREGHHEHHGDAPQASFRFDADGTIDWDDLYSQRDQTWSGNPNASLIAHADALPCGRALDVGCGEGADAIWLADRGWRVTALEVSEVALARARAHAGDRAITWVHAGILEATRGVAVGDAGEATAAEAGVIGETVPGHGAGLGASDANEASWGAGIVGPPVGTAAGTVGGAAGVDSAVVVPALPVAGFDLVSVHYPGLRRTPGAEAERAMLDLVAPGGRFLAVFHADVDVEQARSHGFDPDDYVGAEQIRAALGNPQWRILVDGRSPRAVTTGRGAHHMDDLIILAQKAP
ncbi:MAG: class I SAM-dependent methyltransferase [Angustibacter sp.]